MGILTVLPINFSFLSSMSSIAIEEALADVGAACANLQHLLQARDTQLAQAEAEHQRKGVQQCCVHLKLLFSITIIVTPNVIFVI
jgi:hypothetical protein